MNRIEAKKLADDAEKLNTQPFSEAYTGPYPSAKQFAESTSPLEMAMIRQHIAAAEAGDDELSDFYEPEVEGTPTVLDVETPYESVMFDPTDQQLTDLYSALDAEERAAAGNDNGQAGTAEADGVKPDESEATDKAD